MTLVPGQASSNNDSEEKEESFGKDFKFYKSQITGLSIQIGDTPAVDEQPTVVRFVPYEFFDEKRGEHYKLGFLATDEQEAIEVLEDDPNATLIDEKEFKQALKDGKRAAY